MRKVLPPFLSLALLTLVFTHTYIWIARKYMRRGISVWLDVPVEALAQRITIIGTDSRPLLHSEARNAYMEVNDFSSMVGVFYFFFFFLQNVSNYYKSQKIGGTILDRELASKLFFPQNNLTLQNTYRLSSVCLSFVKKEVKHMQMSMSKSPWKLEI